MSLSIRRSTEPIFFGNEEPINQVIQVIKEIPIEEPIKEEPQSEDNTILVEKYKRYKTIMAQANKKYREANKEKVNKIAKAYYDRHKDDEEWRKKQCEKSKRAYLKKKEKVKQETTALTIQL
jgi:hypothetical protein